MTILVSSVSPSVIVMLSDSTVTITHYPEEGAPFNDYETESKYYIFHGIGCITTWGDRTFNRLGHYLHKQGISSNTHSVKDLAELTRKYIRDEYSKEYELGFHIGGFENSKPYLYHVFWGFDRPKPPHQNEPTDHLYDHSNWVFLYNGRNDLAQAVLATLKEQIESNQEVCFDINTPLGRISLCDFIARFASEITPQIGPPFTIHLIFPDNSIEKIENVSYSPISIESITMAIPKLMPLPNFVKSGENVVLGIMPISSSESSPTGTPKIESPYEQPQAGTISYVLPKKRDSGEQNL